MRSFTRHNEKYVFMSIRKFNRAFVELIIVIEMVAVAAGAETKEIRRHFVKTRAF